MTKKIVPNKGMIDIEVLSSPDAFKSKVNLDAVPKFNKHGDNIEPIIRRIPVQSIDEYAFNPRQANNNHFDDIKNSIKEIGLQQRFSVVKNPETGRYTLIKGGNTRLLAFKALYRETSDTKFAAIDCIVEAWEGELNRTQAVIAHLIENEARGELILVDKAKALIELERNFRSDLSSEKESEESSDSKKGSNYKTKQTKPFVDYLKNNGYSVSEGQLGLFRFTANKLTGNLDHFLNQGMGSPQIIKIRSVYNNLKSIVKDSEVDDYHSLDEDFFDALKKYNKTRKSFEFEKLLDVIVGQLAGLYPFFDIFASDISGFKKELLDRTKKPKEKAQVPERNTLNNDVKDIKHDDKDDFNLALTIENENDMGVDADTNSLPVQTSAVDKVVEATHSANHPVVNDEKHEGVTDLDFYRNQAYDLVKTIAFKCNLGNTVIKINHGCGFLLVDTVDESKNDFEDWGLWWLLLGYSHAADLLNPISDLRLLGLADIELNQDLSALYVNTSLSDIEAVDSSLEKINQLSGLYEFRSTNLQSIKDRLMPFLWQDITELEAVCYKIIRATIRDATKLWE